MLPTLHILTWPQRVGYVLNLILVGAGWLLFLALITEWPSAHWSRPALALQAIAAMLAWAIVHRLPSWRLMMHPLILASGIYLWDSTLPPPSLPYGPLRILIPGLILLGLLVDCVMTMWYIHYLRRRTIQIRQRYLRLEDAAMLLGMSPEELRMQLRRHGRKIRVDEQGREDLSLDDLRALIAYEHTWR